MNWKELWMTLFGTTEWLGLNIGFWVALAAVLLIVILMNVLFWSMKPKQTPKTVLIKKTHKRNVGIHYATYKNNTIEKFNPRFGKSKNPKRVSLV